MVNETAEDVWFDDFSISRTASMVIQETHYDPWGLELTGIGFQYSGIKANKYLYNGKELIEDKGLQYYDYGARMYDPVLGRWSVVDPLGDHPKQLGMSLYSAFWNNPIRYNDPDGKCPECEENVNNPIDGLSYMSSGGAEYIFGKGEWTRNGRNLDEVVVTTSKSDSNDFEENTSSLGDIGTGLSLAGEGMWLFGENRSKSFYQQGFRRGLSSNYQLKGTNFSLFGNQTMTSATKPLMGLTNVGKGLSNFGTGFAVAGTLVETYQYSQGDMGGARYSYHLTGTGASIGAAYLLGGPYGAGVGGLFLMGEKAWDITQPMRDEISSQYWQFKKNFNNALRSGWRPR